MAQRTKAQLLAERDEVEVAAAMHLVAAGYWPWPETDDADNELAVRVLLSVVRGDYRVLEDAGC